MRNIYDVFNNTKKIEAEDEIFTNEQASELVARLDIKQKKKLNKGFVAACVAGAIILSGGTAYAYNSNLFSDLVAKINRDRVPEKYMQCDILDATYEGEVEVIGELPENVKMEVLKAEVTEGYAHIAMIITVDGYNLNHNGLGIEGGEIGCGGEDLLLSSVGMTFTNSDYGLDELADNQMFAVYNIYLKDTAAVMNSGKLELHMDNLLYVTGEEEENISLAKDITLVIPICNTSFAVKKAVITDGAKYDKIELTNYILRLERNATPEDAKQNADFLINYNEEIKLITNDGTVLENISLGGGAVYDLDTVATEYEWLVPIDIEQVSYVEIDGIRYEMK